VKPLDWTDLPPALTVAEAGRLLRLGRYATYEGCRTGQIPSVRIGRRLIIPRDRLRLLLEGGHGDE
jgi:excisionase family DNA binding protein